MQQYLSPTKTPLISIIIPVYNVAPYIEESLDSVIRQTYTNLEIIVVDDGSDDGSSIICDHFVKADSRIQVVHQNNKGLSAARNIGLEKMTGEIVAFLDSDDAYDKDYISRMITAMNCTNADIVVCSHTNCYTDGRMDEYKVSKNTYSHDYLVYDRVEALQALAMFSITSYVWNKLYRKALWEQIRFPEGHVYEDIATTFRVLDSCGRVCVLRDELYLRRNRQNSITNSVSENNINDCLSACISFECFIKDNIPIVFSSDHLVFRQSSRLKQMIEYYLLYSTQIKNSEKKHYLGYLRQQIALLGNYVGLGQCTFRSRVYYYLITRFHWILDLGYPFYVSVNNYLRN